MDVFEFRKRIIEDYERFSRSFCKIKAEDIARFVDVEYRAEKFWPAPLIQLNPNFVPGNTIEDLVDAGLWHEECRKIFRVGKTAGDVGKAMRLHKHQEDAVRMAQQGESYVLTTGTGSGKSLAYFIPIIRSCMANVRLIQLGAKTGYDQPLDHFCRGADDAIRSGICSYRGDPHSVGRPVSTTFPRRQAHTANNKTAQSHT